MSSLLLAYYDRKPCDWILDDFIRGLSCGSDKSDHDCRKAVAAASIRSEFPIFKHKGAESSLVGKRHKVYRKVDPRADVAVPEDT